MSARVTVTDAMVEEATLALVNSRRELRGISPIDRMPWAATSDMERRHVAAALGAVVPGIIQQAKAEALRAAADAIDLEDAAKQSDLNDLDYDWTGHYWESVAEEWLRARAGKTERGES